VRYTDKKPYVEEMHLSGVNRQRIYKQSFVHDPFFVDFNTLRFDRSADNVTPDKTPFSMLLDIRLSKNRLKISFDDLPHLNAFPQRKAFCLCISHSAIWLSVSITKSLCLYFNVRIVNLVLLYFILQSIGNTTR
jgi:hypothetical protein